MNKHIKGRAPNAWNEERRLDSEERILAALEKDPLSRADMKSACDMKETTIWRTVDTLLSSGRIVDAAPRIGANRCQERMFRLCDPLTGPIPIQKKARAVEKVSRDPFIAALFGACESQPVTPIPARVHRMIDDEAEAA